MTPRIAGFALTAAAAFGSICWVAAGRPSPVDRQPYPLDLKSLTHFKFDPQNPQDQIPRRVKELDGKAVSFEGFIHNPVSPDHSGRVTRFEFNDDSYKTWGWPVQERVCATVPSGFELDQADFAVLTRVAGILHVGVQRDSAGKVESIFRLEVSKVEPV